MSHLLWFFSIVFYWFFLLTLYGCFRPTLTERKNTDPEGAITISKTMLESICQHILLKKGIEFKSNRIELPELYKKTAHALNIAPDQHSEQIFKQILGGCSGIVNGLGTLRNHFGDAHGKGPAPI